MIPFQVQILDRRDALHAQLRGRTAPIACYGVRAHDSAEAAQIAAGEARDNIVLSSLPIPTLTVVHGRWS